MSYESELNAVIGAIAPTDPAAEEAAWTRLDNLTTPPRSLGRVEGLAARVACVQGTDRPSVAKKVVLLMAGDHGVVEEGVAVYPQDVTWQMVANIVGKGAAINQFAASVGADVLVHDVGVIRDLSDMPGVVIRKVAPGTRNMAVGPAMTREEAAQAVMVGVQAARDAVAAGAELISTGDMGIGNTTPASALTAVFADAEPALVCGRGTGLDDEGVAHKVAVVERALQVNGVNELDPLGVLAAVGGLEIAALAGVVLGAAEQRTCVVFDGFISGSAALAAVRICPAAADYLFPSHRSVEPGHSVQLDALGLEPVLELDMRLGEGTGGALTMGIIDAACRMISNMATFAEAGVSDKE
ncbi:MAG: nicotinate-nucleotide--dimethylbenzimidazole phosphoribosyltransferase [Coriobacteriia bacterium]|nr:nicotinate-nucleotide--dimethylbenzimidazole phosphoribosyltransferase [Coriobacteriia bacterium]